MGLPTAEFHHQDVDTASGTSTPCLVGRNGGEGGDDSFADLIATSVLMEVTIPAPRGEDGQDISGKVALRQRYGNLRSQ